MGRSIVAPAARLRRDKGRPRRRAGDDPGSGPVAGRDLGLFEGARDVDEGGSIGLEED